MDKYRVEILNRAYKNIDDIYEYIAKELLASDAAIFLVESLKMHCYLWKLCHAAFPQEKQEDMPIKVIDRFL